MRGIKFVFASILVCQFLIIIDAQVTYLGSACNDTSPDNKNVYEENLNLLFKNFTSKSTVSKFYNSTAGDNSDKVYGLFQCRDDVTSTVCSACVKNATQMIVKECPVDREAIVWSLECMLRYANRNFFSIYEYTPLISFGNDVTTENYENFSLIQSSTMDDIIKNASLSSTYFASDKTNLTSSKELYSFAQCTLDVDTDGCGSCLKLASIKMNDCCGDSTAKLVYMPSCQLGYDTSPFMVYQSLTPMSASNSGPSKKNVGNIVAIAVCVPFALVVLLVFLWIRLFRKRTKGRTSDVPQSSPRGLLNGAVNGDHAYNFGEIEFMEYDLATLKNATRDFSEENVLGEGGFGTVYKGILENGRPLAIKRLSVASRLSRDDFMTSVDLLAELRHTNLARLVGFCYEGVEKILVYELMSNASLDRFLFDPRRRPLLGWLARYNIILGIAKGLQYLHEDSHLSIVHGHLKPNNILLDRDMNPKITDFGLDKLLNVEQIPRRNTSRNVRTKGYVAPEYRTLGTDSKESDVYSFGIMLLEIVSGQKNRLFNRSPHNEDLPIHAWRLWNDGRPFDLTDPALYNNCSSNDVIRCIQIGLLCVQANADERPTMATIVMMLAGYVDIPLPTAPATSSHQVDMGTESYSDDQQSDPDQSAAKTVTWRTEFEQDLYPRPR